MRDNLMPIRAINVLHTEELGRDKHLDRADKESRPPMNLAAPIYTGPRPGSPEQVNAIISELRNLYPTAACSLDFTNPLELLVATQLSAQCTDVTAKLFQKYTNAEAFADASQEDLEQDIRSTGFFRNKAKNIRAASQRIISTYGGNVPRTMEELLTLPGVARKTANVVLGNAFGIAIGFVVDTHVGRLARRFGWTINTDPVKIEQELMRIVPQADWLDLSHLLIFHGRAICDARRPLCEQCSLAQLCPSAFTITPASRTTKSKKTPTL
jgi:endonuclease-3